MGIANIADQVLLWLHGRRLGILGDGQTNTNSAIVLDEKVVATTRTPILKVFTSLSAAGAVTVAGAVVGDNVISVTNLTTDADVSSSFETTVTVAGQLQQKASTSAAPVLVYIQPQS